MIVFSVYVKVSACFRMVKVIWGGFRLRYKNLLNKKKVAVLRLLIFKWNSIKETLTVVRTLIKM